MLIKLNCPKCTIENNLSLIDATHQGAYRCWKCRELFAIKIENNELKSCEPISQEEFDRQREIESLKDKFRKK